MSGETSLILNENDARILQAAKGVRPAFDDDDSLPDGRYQCALSTASYNVSKRGFGTSVTLYGTDTVGRSVAVHAVNFRPYLYVSLAEVDKVFKTDERRTEMIERLIDELQRQLLLACALDKSRWSPERLAMRESYAGRVRISYQRRQYNNKDRDNRADSEDQTRVWLEAGNERCRPIVGYEITDGLPAKGHGPGSGYRGMRASRFLKIYLYAPSLVTKARSLLHGKNSELGAEEQARRLALGRHRAQNEGADGGGEAAPTLLSQWDKATHAADQGRLTGWMPEPVDNGSQGEVVANLDNMEDELADDGIDPDEDEDDNDDNDDDSDEDSETVGEASDDDDNPSPVTEVTVSRTHVEAVKADFEARLDRRLKRRALRAVHERPLVMLADGRAYDVFEADIDFVLRFALDCDFAWEQWVEFDWSAELHQLPDGRPADNTLRVQRLVGEKRSTRAQIELRLDYRLIKRVDDEQLQNTMPQHVQLSLDCEMEPGPHGEFPRPESERMLQCVCVVRGEPVVGIKNKFYFRTVSFVLGSVDCRAEPRQYCTERHLLCFRTESLLFAALAKFVAALDPHVVTGYNTDGFDLPYMLERAKHLSASGADIGDGGLLGVGDRFEKAWGRNKWSSRMRVRERSFASSQAGTIVFTDIMAEGVVFLDLLKKLQRDPLIKLRSYSLNAVANHFIGDQKEDIAYSQIRTYQRTPTGREKLRSYCEKDALLPLELFEQLLIMPGMIEMARINNCTMEVLLNRGQQVRSKCCLYRAGARESPPIRFYTRTEQERAQQANDTFQGATVVDPVPGLYEEPVFTLDWSSLYPSIMVTHNLCMTSRVQADYDLTTDPDIMGCEDPVNELTVEERQRRAEAAVWRVPDMVRELPYEEASNAQSAVFLRHPIRLGIVPKVQINYLEYRGRTKAQMKQAYIDGDMQLAALLNQRQMAIKMLANSLYGMLGATCSFGYTPVVSSTVTLRGRCLLYLMRSLAMIEFERYGSRVVYGDTDSIFVHVPRVTDIGEAAKIGVEMSEYITGEMKRRYTTDSPDHNILNLEFEKVFRKILLLAKKRYAGLKYEYDMKTEQLTPKPADGVPITSGLETKRRDTTLLISNTLDDVIALLLDYRYPLAKNLARTRAFVWQRMVRPLLQNTINLRLLVVTKQLRMLPSHYKAARGNQAMPIHVQLAQKLIDRAGGEDSQNAPRAGTRLPYVVVEGRMDAKVSERGEDPVYALENDLKIDSRYYLDRHVKPPLLRLLVPIVCNQRQTQQTLGAEQSMSGVDRQFGDTEAARKRHNDNVAAEFLFGHMKEYRDPTTAAERALYADIVPMAKENKAVVRSRPRYTRQRLQTEATVVSGTKSRQSTLAAFARSGARCKRCRTFVADASAGAMCADCVAQTGSGARSETEMRRYLLDIEDLHDERRELADTCHACMGCRDAPRTITCQNTDCKVLWDRKQNQSSIEELETRMQSSYQVLQATSQLQALQLTDDDNDDDDGDEEEPKSKLARKK